MATPLEWFAGVSWFVNLVLDIGAAYYCYRLTKITGGFRAWWLIIGFTIAFAVSSFFSVSYGVITSEVSRAASAASSTLVGASVLDILLNLLMSVLLFAAMFELHRTFRRMQKKESGQA